MMLRTPEERQASEMPLFKKPKEIVKNCQPEQDEVDICMKKKQENMEIEESEMRRKTDKIRKVFKKT